MKFKPPFRWTEGKKSWLVDARDNVVRSSDVIRLLNAGAKAMAAKKPKVAPVKLHSGWVLDKSRRYGCTVGRHRKQVGALYFRMTETSSEGTCVIHAACLACARKGLPK